MLNPIIFSIEGNIGSGKSSIIEYLKSIKYEEFSILNKNIQKIIFIPEPVDDWNTIKDSDGNNILAKFYKNKTKYSFSFQMMAYITRLSKIKNIIKNNPNSIFITERSLHTDKNVFAKMLYHQKNMEDVEFQIYNRWFNEFDIIKLTNIIYVKSEPDICKTRISIRNREGEQNISLDYLKQCHQYHEDWLSSIQKDNIKEHNLLVLDGNIDKKNKINYNEEVGNTIIKFIQSICNK